MKKMIFTSALYDCQTPYLKPLFERSTYPWDMLPKIGDYIKTLLMEGIEGYTQVAEGILVGQNVKIHPNAVIEPPAVIGSGTDIRHGAYLRGNVILGEGCVIGNSSELKNCILLTHVQVPHYNYVGDSILGNFAHMGAGAICSNLKMDKKVVVIHGDIEYETGLRKVGSMLGDHADVGCGCVLNPGTVIGPYTTVYPLTPLRGVYPDHAIVKKTDIVVPRRED